MTADKVRPEFSLAEALAIATANAESYKDVASVSRTLAAAVRVLTVQRDEAQDRAQAAVRALRRTLLALGKDDPGTAARARWRDASLYAIAGLVTDETIYASAGPIPVGSDTGGELWEHLTAPVAPPPATLAGMTPNQLIELWAEDPDTARELEQARARRAHFRDPPT